MSAETLYHNFRSWFFLWRLRLICNLLFNYWVAAGFLFCLYDGRFQALFLGVAPYLLGLLCCVWYAARVAESRFEKKLEETEKIPLEILSELLTLVEGSLFGIVFKMMATVSLGIYVVLFIFSMGPMFRVPFSLVFLIAYLLRFFVGGAFFVFLAFMETHRHTNKLDDVASRLRALNNSVS